jgi:hypothetical protein
MSTRRLMLRWNAPKPGDYPFGPIAQIVPKLAMQLDSGPSLISPDCATEEEWNQEIEVFKADLEAIRIEGCEKFREHLACPRKPHQGI